MYELSMQRQKRQFHDHQPLHILLHDYYMALETGNRVGAEAVIAEIQSEGLLDAVNALFLQTMVVSRFGALKELYDSGVMLDLMVIRRPTAVTEALVSLIYRSELSAFESVGDVQGSVQAFRGLRRLYPDLYRSWSGMRTAEAAKSFLLAAHTANSPDIVLRDAILARVSDYSPEDGAWMETIAANFPTSGVVSKASSLVNTDNTVESLLRSPASVDDVRLLCGAVTFNDTLELREAIRIRYGALSPTQQRDLRSSKLASKLLDDLMQSPTGDPTQVVPQNWQQWFFLLKTTSSYWSVGVDLVRKHASEWLLADGDSLPAELNGLIFELQERQELMEALPHFINTARKDAYWPRRDWSDVYEVVMNILSTYTKGGIDDLTVWEEMAEALLQLGTASENYHHICTEASRLFNMYLSASTLDFATEFLDILLFYPCPDEQARRDLFLVVVNRAHAFSRLLEPSQRAFLGILASDFGQLEWKVAFSPDRNLAPEDADSVFDELNGKLIAIYSLSERVSRRAKDIFKNCCPSVEVRINSDHVATNALKQLAKEADIFVVNTASAKHAATTFISATRKPSQTTLFHNARGSQSLVKLVEYFLRDS
jgi:hypothetical protein